MSIKKSIHRKHKTYTHICIYAKNKYINLNVYNYKIIVYKMDRYLYNYLYIYIL